jgi:hypothetical protein
MLDEEQATTIVVNCIRAVSHVQVVKVEGTLDDSQISDDTRVNNMITLIVNSPNIGVPSFGHSLDPQFFQGLGSDAGVSDVIDTVRDDSVPLAGPA